MAQSCDHPQSSHRDMEAQEYLNCDNKDEENIDNFHYMRYIGRGGFSKVFMVKSKINGGVFVMKCISKSKLAEVEYGSSVIKYEKNVFNIARKTPFLVKLLTMFENESKYFIVMEHCGGGDLLSFLHTRGHLSEDDARFFGAEICAAVSFLHDNDIIHRDLKTSNVLLDYNGHIKVCDYGSCYKGTLASTILGTITYSAPELYGDTPYGQSVDWWAVGVIIYQLLTGKTPFSGQSDSSHGATSGLDSGSHMSFETNLRIYTLIHDLEVLIPPTMSPAAGSIILGFLMKNPAERLGCVNSNDVREHSFFSNIDWQQVLNCELSPPFVPFTQGREPTLYIDF